MKKIITLPGYIVSLIYSKGLLSLINSVFIRDGEIRLTEH